MHKWKQRTVFSLILIFIFIFSFTSYKTFGETTYYKDKKWTVKFSKELNDNELNSGNITVVDSKNLPISVALTFGQEAGAVSKKVINVNAPLGGYKEGETYTLKISKNVKSKDGKYLKPEVTKIFKISGSILKEDTVTFMDRSLSSAVYSALKKADSSFSGDFHKSDLLKITSLDASKYGVTNLQGIENLKNLTYLNLTNNSISDFSYLSTLTNLKSLYISGNSSKDYTPLGYLYGALTAKDFTMYTVDDKAFTFQDKGLELSIRSALSKDGANLFTGNIHQSDLDNITALYGDSYGISNISGIENLKNLKLLHLSNNNIVDITPLKNLTGIEDLSLFNNKIIDISSLSGLNKLINLFLGENGIKDFGPTKTYYNNLQLKDF